MPVRFVPTGSLDIATSPQALPESSDGQVTVSGALVRCSNLVIPASGVARTRPGSAPISATVHEGAISAIVELLGHLYVFSMGIYLDGVAITDTTGAYKGPWYVVVALPYNTAARQLFVTNGKKLLRLDEGSVKTWGLEAPEDPPTAHKWIGGCYMYEWEGSTASCSMVFDTYALINNYAYTYTWESAYPPGNTFGYTQTWEAALLRGAGFRVTPLLSAAFPSVATYTYSWESWTTYMTDALVGLYLVTLNYLWFPAIGDSNYYSTASWERGIGNVSTTRLTLTVTSQEPPGPDWKRWTLQSENGYEGSTKWEIGQVEGDESLFPDDGQIMFWFEHYSGTETAKYSVAYTYCRYLNDLLECESNPSDPAETLIGSGCYVEWTASEDPSVTHVRIYRSLQDRAELYLDSEYPVGQLSAVLTAADDELGALVDSDHDPPPTGLKLISGPHYGGVYFGAVGNKLYWSRGGQPEYWPALQNVEVGPPDQDIIAMAAQGGQLYVANKNEIYAIQGLGSNAYVPLATGATTGTRSPLCFLPIRGIGIAHLGSDGLYMFSAAGDECFTRGGPLNIDPLFRDESAGGLEPIDRTRLVDCWLTQIGNQVYFSYPTQGARSGENLFVFDMDTKRARHETYPVGFSCAGLSDDRRILYVGGSDLQVWRLGVGSQDNGADVEWEIESKEFGALRKYAPRSARYDVDVEDSVAATGEILLDNVAVQEHALTRSRDTRRRLISSGSGDRLSIRLRGTGLVEIYAVEVI